MKIGIIGVGYIGGTLAAAERDSLHEYRSTADAAARPFFEPRA